MAKRKRMNEYDMACLTCKYFKELPSKELRYDFGFCINPMSPWYYVVLFEHHPSCKYWREKGGKDA